VTQAPFFDPGVESEVRRRTAENRAGIDLGVVAREHADTAAVVAREQTEWMGMHAEWRKDMERSQKEQARLLAEIVAELRVMNLKLDGQAKGAPRTGTRTPAGKRAN
jgi:hypothetical protein